MPKLGPFPMELWSSGGIDLHSPLPPKKNRNFNLLILPDAPGFLTLTQGHEKFVKMSWE